MTTTLYTFGHWYFGRGEITKLLKMHDIDLLMDVRSFPGSRKNPDVHTDSMAQWLPEAGIAYANDKRLGGRRNKPEDLQESDLWWRVIGFRNYSGHTRTEEFKQGYSELMELAELGSVAIMCGEPSFTRCHRRIISDLAVMDGHRVLHIKPDGRLGVHEPSGWATSALGSSAF